MVVVVVVAVVVAVVVVVAVLMTHFLSLSWAASLEALVK